MSTRCPVRRRSARSATTGSRWGSSPHARRHVPRTRSSSGRSSNCARGRISASTSSRHRGSRPSCMGPIPTGLSEGSIRSTSSWTSRKSMGSRGNRCSRRAIWPRAPRSRSRARGARRVGARRPAQAAHGWNGWSGWRGRGTQLMSDTFFSGAPHWTWFIIPYFFVGGLAGGAYFLAAVLDWFGRPEDRPVVRTGYDVAAVGAILSGLLLTIDLGRPLRFWHMLFQSENFPAIMFKGWSPISFGAWAILLFGLCSVLSALGARAEEGRLQMPALRAVGGVVRGGVARLVSGAGGLVGLFIAGYTGILLSVTNRPIWADSPWLGALFIASGASTGAATLILLSPGRGATERTLTWLSSFDARALVVELLVLAAFVVSLGSVNRVWLSFWGLLLRVGVVGFGILAPLRMRAKPAQAARLVLLGGFLLRLATILASEGIDRYRVAAGL